MTRGRLKGLLYLVTRALCRPLRVVGRSQVPKEPVVFVANHSSHADTAVLLAALPPVVRRNVAPAAAEDYFFGRRIKGMLVRALTGAFPFPRQGCEGIERACALLTQGHSVLIYPEGTRSQDGSVGEFRCGVGLLAQRGAMVVPVGIAGTREVLPKGRNISRRAPVAVVFGKPRIFGPDVSSKDVAVALRGDVCELTTEATRTRPAAKASPHRRVAQFARSRAALWLVFCWSIAEALWWPIIPDFLVAPLALAAPGRWFVLAAAATAGSVLGGGIAFHLGPAGDWLASKAPLLTSRMHEQAAAWVSEAGGAGLLQQPLSGIPYKVFALHAAEAGLSLPGFIAVSVVARGLRIGAVAAIFAGGGVALERVWPRLFGVFLIAYCIVFAFGLSATVESWR